jgi:hypothetical protein
MMPPKPPPRGIRNHNPGNIRRSKEHWRGLAADQSDPDFFRFASALWGLRALAIVLRNYQAKHGLRTARQIVKRWAPPSENDTGAYIRAVAEHLGVTPDQPLDLRDRGTMLRLVQAIVRHENGQQPYSNDVILAALATAGIGN